VTNPKGTKEESRVVAWLHDNGWPFARRIRSKGAMDEGDIALGDGIPVAIESKATRRTDLAGWMREIEAEVNNSGAEWGFVVVKKRGTQDAGEYYAVLPMKYLNEVMRTLYGRKRQLNGSQGQGPRRRVITRRSM
jgi:hypothetical protein